MRWRVSGGHLFKFGSTVPISKVKATSMKKLTLVVLSAALYGCTAPPRAPLSTIYAEYQNQLVKPDQPFATLSGFPYAQYMDLKWAAFIPDRIDSTITNINRDRQFLGSLPGLYNPHVTFLKLKVPPGRHDVTVRGGKFTGAITLVKGVEFKVGKSYVISEASNEKEGRLVLISAYTADTRFSVEEKEHYILESPPAGVARLGDSE